MATILERPAAAEFAPYYGRYIDLVPAGDLVAMLEQQRAETRQFLAGLPEAKAGHRYAEGKWSIREVIGHLADAERVFAYRALRFARADATPLPGFDEQAWAKVAPYDARRLADISAEFDAVRGATIAFARSVAPEELARAGEASGKMMSVRALLYVIAGHERHHMAIIKERYL